MYELVKTIFLKECFIMRNRMYFGDLLVTREIKALDSAWEEFVQDEYRLMFMSEIQTSAIERIEDKRTLYLEERARLKGKFSKKEEESEVEDGEAFSDPLIVDDLVGEALPEITDENRDMVKEARGFVFNEHPEVKEKTCDGLEEFLRRTLKEDE
jgi:hypothetical protein